MFTRSFPAMARVLPNRRQVRSDVAKTYAIGSKRLSGRLRMHTGVFHVATDAWTDRAGNAFIGVVLHWSEVVDTVVNHVSCLIDFISLVLGLASPKSTGF